LEPEDGLWLEPQLFEALPPTPSSPGSGSTTGRPATDDDFQISPDHDIDLLFGLLEEEQMDITHTMDTSNSTFQATNSDFMSSSATTAFGPTYSTEEKVFPYQPSYSPSQEQPTVQPLDVLTPADIVDKYLVAPPSPVSIHPAPAWSQPVSEPFNIRFCETTDANIPVFIEAPTAPPTAFSVPLDHEVTRATITINSQVDIGDTVSREPKVTGRGKRQNGPAKTNQERCRTYRERTKKKKDEEAKDLLRLTEKNTALKIKERIKREEVERMKQLLKMMGFSV